VTHLQSNSKQHQQQPRHLVLLAMAAFNVTSLQPWGPTSVTPGLGPPGASTPPRLARPPSATQAASTMGFIFPVANWERRMAYRAGRNLPRGARLRSGDRGRGSARSWNAAEARRRNGEPRPGRVVRLPTKPSRAPWRRSRHERLSSTAPNSQHTCKHRDPMKGPS
jgi:hypothetical protein